MQCIQCNETIPSDSRFCNKCGTETGGDIFVQQPRQVNDTPLVLGYVGWLLLNHLIIVGLQKMIFAGFGRIGSVSVITQVNLVLTIIDILFMLLIVAFAKSRLVKTVFTVFFVVKLILRLFVMMT